MWAVLLELFVVDHVVRREGLSGFGDQARSGPVLVPLELHRRIRILYVVWSGLWQVIQKRRHLGPGSREPIRRMHRRTLGNLDEEDGRIARRIGNLEGRDAG